MQNLTVSQKSTRRLQIFLFFKTLIFVKQTTWEALTALNSVRSTASFFSAARSHEAPIDEGGRKEGFWHVNGEAELDFYQKKALICSYLGFLWCFFFWTKKECIFVTVTSFLLKAFDAFSRSTQCNLPSYRSFCTCAACRGLWQCTKCFQNQVFNKLPTGSSVNSLSLLGSFVMTLALSNNKLIPIRNSGAILWWSTQIGVAQIASRPGDGQTA